MGKFKQLNTDKKKFLLNLKKFKYSYREMGVRVGCSASTVSYFFKKYCHTRSLERSKGGGRQKITSGAQDQRLLHLSLTDRFKTSRELQVILKEKTGVDISGRTVRRRLQNGGLSARRPKKKPLLTKKMKKKRLEFAESHEHWTSNEWWNVIWSDESKFNLFGNDGIQFVRRRPGEAYDKKCVLQAPKHPASVMVWGCFSGDDLGKLEFLEGKVNADKYIEVLDKCLLPSVESIFAENEDFIFQQDHAPCHTAKKVSILLLLQFSVNSIAFLL